LYFYILELELYQKQSVILLFWKNLYYLWDKTTISHKASEGSQLSM